MFLKSADLSSRESYEYYKENRKGVAEGLNQYTLFRKAVEGMFQELGSMMLENPNGACIRGLGYLCFVRTKNKKLSKNPKKNVSILRKYKRKHTYTPYLFVDEIHKGWYMEGTFGEAIRYGLYNSKLKYKVHKTICDGIILSEYLHNNPKIKIKDI